MRGFSSSPADPVNLASGRDKRLRGVRSRVQLERARRSAGPGDRDEAMADEDNYGTERRVPAWMEQRRIEFLLRSEITFWRDLVTSCGDAVPAESIERMKQALALAESRLLQLYRGDRDGIPSSSGPERTSEPTDTPVN